VGLFSLLGPEALGDLLGQLLAGRLEAQEAFGSPAAGEDSLPGTNPWEERLAAEFGRFLDDPEAAGALAELDAMRQDGRLARAEAAGDGLAPQGWDSAWAARRAGDAFGLAAAVSGLRAHLKPAVGQAGNWRPAEPKAAVRALKERFEVLIGAWAGKGMDPELDRRWAQARPALGRLLARAAEGYRAARADLGALDFDDLEERALRLLAEDEAVRARWQAEVQALLVDEFQDTNRRQRDLIRLLNGDRSRLFIVGDAKQSIYRFRGADVTVFRQEREAIAAQGGAVATLATSYRAHEALVGLLNDMLRPVLGETELPGRAWREPFAPLVAHRTEPWAGMAGPYLELCLALGAKSGGGLQRAARALARRLVALVEGEVEGLRYQDIAILCRASTSFAAYEDALDWAGVPYLTTAGRGFFDRPEVRDLLNALACLADPSDDLALAGLLRSPALGLSDADLLALSRRRQATTGQERPSLWRAMQECQGEVWRRAGALIGRLHRLAGRTQVAALLKAFLDETGYRAALQRAGQGRAARNVDKLLADAQASSLVRVGEFLEYVTALRVDAVREGEARAAGGDAVRLMTAHGAKGLEFPVVVLGDATYQRPDRDALFLDRDLGPLYPLAGEDGSLPCLYQMQRREELDREEAEADRLLYVAATRARDKVIVSGAITLKGDGRPGRLKGWLGRLDGCLELGSARIPGRPDGDGVIALDLPAGRGRASGILLEEGHSPPPIARPVPAAPEAVAPGPWAGRLLEPISAGAGRLDGKASHDPEDVQQLVWEVIGPPGTRAPAHVVGYLVHEALAAWRFPDATFERWARARARDYGLVEPEQAADAARRAGRLLARFGEHSLRAEIQGAERRLHEVPYALLDDQGRPEHGTIDLLYRRDGRWTVVDFKSEWLADPPSARQRQMVARHQEQLDRYAAAVERLLGERPRTCLCLLDAAGRVALV
jgi:ATP-dependent helicase/nuclease subunit A